MKILLAEDTTDLNRAITAVLTHDRYEVDPVYDGAEALAHIRAGSYALVILDIMMPKMSGIEVLREMRTAGNLTPVLLLTAKTEIEDRVTGLDAGADDYLTKPFAMKELLARVRALGRRQVPHGTKPVTFSDLTLRPEDLELSSENSIRLAMKECELMQLLIDHAGRPLSTEFIRARIWGGEPDATSDTVWLYISYLRGKLRAIASDVSIEGSRGGSFVLTDNK